MNESNLRSRIRKAIGESDMPADLSHRTRVALKQTAAAPPAGRQWIPGAIAAMLAIAVVAGFFAVGAYNRNHNVPVGPGPKATATPLPSPSTSPNSLGAVTDLAVSSNAVYALYAPTGTEGPLAGAGTTMVARIDRRTQAVVKAGPFPGALHIAVGSGGVWVAGNRLMLLDADSLKQLTEIALPAETAGSIEVVASTAGVWVAHGRHVYRLDAKTGRTLQTRMFSGIATSIALSPNGGRIYVGADGDPFAWYSVATINAFDTSTLNEVASTQTDGAGLGGPKVAAANDGVWAAIATGMQGYVEHRRASDLSRLPVPPSDQRHSNGVRVYVAGGYVWATDGGTGRLDCLDPQTGSVLSSKEHLLGGVVAGDSSSIYVGGSTGVESLTPDPSCKRIS
jgi:DNA-binding beta-propeller fold protein YncE